MQLVSSMELGNVSNVPTALNTLVFVWGQLKVIILIMFSLRVTQIKCFLITADTKMLN